jgi:hypothetical protein
MREDFCAFILTHGRPNKVITYQTLRSHGYTGKVFIVIDDEDETGEEYKRIFGDNVLVFSKDEVGEYTDKFDNFADRRAVVWARNACWDLAKQMGYRYFIQLDDDYHSWRHRRRGRGHQNSISTAVEYHSWKIKHLDMVFDALVRLVETTPIKTIALSQGGDHQQRGGMLKRFRRKAMNSFVCATDKPFLFRGRFNDDVNTYVSLGRTGDLFFTDMQLMLAPGQTQGDTGGMAEAYRDSGTYVKSFYTVMAAPSCTTVGVLGSRHQRPHHRINWRKAFPLILSELFKKVDNTIASLPTKTQTVNPAHLIKIPPRQFVNDFLSKYDSLYPMDKKFAKNIIDQILRHRGASKQHPIPLPQYMLALEDRWYASLASGTPDYSVYDDDYYFTEMWVCWAIYSRNYLRTLLKPSVYSLVENIKTIADLGCGIGYTTAGFKQLFPSSDVVGTNVEETRQYQFCTAMGQSYDFKMASSINELEQCDLVFASEYFEHILAPITHLEEVLITLYPKFLYIANSFNTRSAGHFDYYLMGSDWLSAAKIQSVFNKTLQHYGYRRLEINAWNNKPALWIKNRQPA